MQDIRINGNKLKKSVQPVLGEWIKMVNRYTNDIDVEDSLYSYNERATLSTLSGAAWKSGWIALEEFSSFKGKRKLRLGRVDLWLYNQRNREEFIIEAKQVWVSISPRAKETVVKIEKALKTTLTEAVEAAEKEQYAIGIVFVIPMVPARYHNKIDTLIQSFIGDFEQVRSDILAYTFPENGKVFCEEYQQYFPGVILFGRMK